MQQRNKQNTKPIVGTLAYIFAARDIESETDSQHHQLLQLCAHANRHGVCNPPRELLAKKIRCGLRVVDRNNAYWRTLGILTWRKGRPNQYKNESNEYQLNLTAMHALLDSQSAASHGSTVTQEVRGVTGDASQKVRRAICDSAASHSEHVRRVICDSVTSHHSTTKNKSKNKNKEYKQEENENVSISSSSPAPAADYTAYNLYAYHAAMAKKIVADPIFKGKPADIGLNPYHHKMARMILGAVEARADSSGGAEKWLVQHDALAELTEGEFGSWTLEDMYRFVLQLLTVHRDVKAVGDKIFRLPFPAPPEPAREPQPKRTPRVPTPEELAKAEAIRAATAKVDEATSRAVVWQKAGLRYCPKCDKGAKVTALDPGCPVCGEETTIPEVWVKRLDDEVFYLRHPEQRPTEEGGLQ